jgi:hypothetical protein
MPFDADTTMVPASSRPARAVEVARSTWDGTTITRRPLPEATAGRSLDTVRLGDSAMPGRNTRFSR